MSETVELSLWSTAPLNLMSGKSHTITCRTSFTCTRVEIEDVNFHHNSAVLLPSYSPLPEETSDPQQQGEAEGLSALVLCYCYAEQNPQKHILIAGHTDTSGPAEYNVYLSKLRARNIHAVLGGNRPVWVETAQERAKVEDYQFILKWLTETKFWDCNPGNIDNIHGEKTGTAVRNFKSQYNVDYGKNIPITGVVGKETWEAFFDIYTDTMGEMLGIAPDEFTEMRAALDFCDPPCIGCGEKYPLTSSKNGVKSAVDRRVDILFFDDDDVPPLGENGKITPCEALYSGKYYSITPIPTLPGEVCTVQVFDEIDETFKGKDIICTLDDGSQVTATTNAAGKIFIYGKTITELQTDDVHGLSEK